MPHPETPSHLSAPRLAPGLRVVRRGLSHLQVGLYAGRRVLLPRTAEVEDTLARLLQQRPLRDDESTAAVLALLDDRGCLDRGRPVSGGKVAVLGEPGSPGLPEVQGLVTGGGLTLISSPTQADVVLVQALGELDRDLVDPLIRRRIPHLVVRMLDGGAVLGPFVLPGVTACLRCVDAHQSLLDPDHVAVSNRYLRATAVPRDDGVPDVPDAALLTLVLSWATRDMVAHVEGLEPATYSRTIWFGRQPSQREEQRWLRHPDCGCSWSAFNPASGTIEA